MNNGWILSLPSYRFIERSWQSLSTTLFDDNKTKDAVLDCITGEVVGMRLRQVDTVDVGLLHPNEDTEVDHHRQTIFREIFYRRVWGKNSEVEFSASGRTTCIRIMTV